MGIVRTVTAAIQCPIDADHPGEKGMTTTDKPRVILAVATETDESTKFIWERLKVIQADMFAVGPIHMKFAYYGAEDDFECPHLYHDRLDHEPGRHARHDRPCPRKMCHGSAI